MSQESEEFDKQIIKKNKELKDELEERFGDGLNGFNKYLLD